MCIPSAQVVCKRDTYQKEEIVEYIPISSLKKMFVRKKNGKEGLGVGMRVMNCGEWYVGPIFN